MGRMEDDDDRMVGQGGDWAERGLKEAQSVEQPNAN